MSDAMDLVVIDDDDNSNAITTFVNVLHKQHPGSLTLIENALVFQKSADLSAPITILWNTMVKHQVSPVTYPKPLLKIIINTTGSSSNLTFQMANRNDLERIRQEITVQLQRTRSKTSSNVGTISTSNHPTTNSNPRKRSLATLQSSDGSHLNLSSFEALDSTILAVTRSSLLAANPALRQQHAHLVLGVEESSAANNKSNTNTTSTSTLTEDDFWQTHQSLLEEEYARISGLSKAGTSSFFASHLPGSGKVVLGVEEMRQIFILYPAVHKAYEEKVPLELSDEQFWRKYLESEYFHRDRGRVGETARNHAGMAANDQQQRSNNKKKSGPSVEEQEARAAAVGTDDLFSRYDQKIRDQQAVADSNAGGAKSHTWGRRLACGQFDLASTYETERGRLLEGPKDNFPPNQLDDGKGSRVIQKYNRHWAMVLHPDDAVAGSDLQSIARKSVDDVLPGDEDPNAGGGIDKEMRQLVDFASAREEDADHAAGIGTHKEHEKLTLSNVEAYHTGLRAAEKASASQEPNDEVIKRHLVAAKAMVSKTDVMARSIVNQSTLPSSCFPPAALGKELLSALTKKMAQDSKTEAASLEVVNKLPKEFRNNLQAYFRRSSELLRHFYGLRKLGAHVPANSQKLARIVGGMETFYREMETMRKALPHSETGETMRKMCLPIMGQLDWAFKLHREGSGGGGGGGFVTVEEG